jgi:D-alanyl-lipoteichoic acid acyltransferase DltB (MBOAT superfamily)
MAKSVKLRKYSFLFVSLGLFILTLGNWQSALIILFFVSFPYCYVKVLQKWNFSVWPAIIIQLAVFIYANKYGWILTFLGIPIPTVIKVLGISYIFFRQFDILFQVQAKLVENVPIIDYLNYLFSFWTILAGPIQRYKDFIYSFYSEKMPLDTKDSLSCFHRAANGMIKILLLGAFFQYCSDAAYLGILAHGISLKYFVAMLYCFPLYLYFNFSGYCDVVIAMARWAGFSLPENFDKPYLSRTVIDFWNRWHITLSQWARDYIYQPLFKYLISGPMSKYVQTSQYFSIFITFFLIGLWHGNSINLVIFGFLQGIGMALSMIYRDICIKKMGKAGFKIYQENKWVTAIERFITLNFMCFSILFIQYDVFAILKPLIGLPVI